MTLTGSGGIASWVTPSRILDCTQRGRHITCHLPLGTALVTAVLISLVGLAALEILTGRRR